MCNRYGDDRAAEDLARRYSVDEQPELFAQLSAVTGAARYNVAPTDHAPVVLARDGARRLEALRWGFLWGQKGTERPLLLTNARAEKVPTNAIYRDAFRQRRCIVPAGWFYEWIDVGHKQPIVIRPRSGDGFSFAGLWNPPGGRDPDAGRYTLITTDPDPRMAHIHDRIPVALAREDEARWLDPEADLDMLQGLLRPLPLEALEMYPVSTYVNNSRSEGPECIRHVEIATAPVQPGLPLE